MINNPYKKYQRTQVTTASKEKILLMLYEGAIKFTKTAVVHMEKKNVAKKGENISKATAILSELMATLDFKQGGQLAADLENLYIFMIDKLIEGNINNDPKCLKVVEELLMTLYTAWKDVIENPRPDGVPSKNLQPKEFEEYTKTGKVTTPDSSVAKEQTAEDKAQNNLKVVA